MANFDRKMYFSPISRTQVTPARFRPASWLFGSLLPGLKRYHEGDDDNRLKGTVLTRCRQPVNKYIDIIFGGLCMEIRGKE
jgi:hypothetical protein